MTIGAAVKIIFKVYSNIVIKRILDTNKAAHMTEERLLEGQRFEEAPAKKEFPVLTAEQVSRLFTNIS